MMYSSVHHHFVGLLLMCLVVATIMTDLSWSKSGSVVSVAQQIRHHQQQKQQQWEDDYRYESFSYSSSSSGSSNSAVNNNDKNDNNQNHFIPHNQQEGQQQPPQQHEEYQQNQHQTARKGQRQRHNKHALRLLATLSDHNSQGGGSWPSVFNVALKALITANATCGQNGREEYCKMVDAHPQRSRAPQCGVCDANSPDPDKRHQISHAIDGSNRWWQSPTLHHGKEFEHVTITLDLRQMYQVFSVVIKSANSPRPASWILERSLDGDIFEPWQYFGSSNVDCQNRFGLQGQHGKYHFKEKDEVICSTQFSKAIPLENGEIHVYLINGRQGANVSLDDLLEFTMARYIRIRLLAMHSSLAPDNNVRWSVDEQALAKRSFYSIRSIRISGRCLCSGHAGKCKSIDGGDLHECECVHNTCGPNCNKCCPLFNQHLFRPGNFSDANICEKCECHGHATECRYSQEIDQRGLSVNTKGEMVGGGVCINCTKYTTGINCEKCLPNYYRPYDTSPHAKVPCFPCDCDPVGAFENCNSIGGECICREGFTGPQCAQCAVGYKGENCTKCSCDVRGTMPGGECESHCQCKLHVEGKYCSECIHGYFSLNAENPEGCQKCYCSGVGLSCRSSEIEEKFIETLEKWRVTDILQTVFAYPSRDNETGYMVLGLYELPEVEAIYWEAPRAYCGNLLSSYGSRLMTKISWVIVRGDTSGKPTAGPSIILVGGNGMKIAFGDEIFKNSNATIEIFLTEEGWYHVPRTVKDIVTRLRRTEYRGDPVTRVQFMSVLSNVESILIRGTFHTDQVESVLNSVTLYSGEKLLISKGFSLVEQCECPVGYIGLSCESCAFGYARIYENSSTHEKLGKCIPCPCNGHSSTCDISSGKCSECLHNTFGERCERCAVGYYGNAMYGGENDCIRCACPLLENSNNFSPSCQLRELSLDIHRSNDVEQYTNNSYDYICTQCPTGYTGDHCEICDDGFYGTPAIIGSKCLPCPCDGGPCDPITGKCIICLGNTEGWRCERCKSGYWGDPSEGCELCECYQNGSISNVCDVLTGQCVCKTRFTGLRCDNCEVGYGNVTLDCPACSCNKTGSSNQICSTVTGQCDCKTGIEGLRCDSCMEMYHDYNEEGCQECLCNRHGSMNLRCNPYTGQCKCRPHVIGKSCDSCDQGFYNLESGCQPCECNLTGSMDNNCNPFSGHCLCKQGVEGINCDTCQDGFYGLSVHGCKKCDSCPSTAYICDQTTGRCVCPALSRGADCQQCFPNTWGWQHRIGCRHCECDKIGSIGLSCDLVTGQCTCREGFTGKNCDECAIGYYGHPNCQRCNCDIKGSISHEKNQIINCDYLGQCPCKELVTGQKCDTCRQATFGLSDKNPEGCTRCYCFGRSQECQQSDLSWGQIRQAGSRNLSVEFITPFRPNEQDYEYVVVVQMEGTLIHREDAEIEKMNRLHLIPSSVGNVSIGAYSPFSYPLYFQLPPNFLGDKITSYGGSLKFTLTTEGCNSRLPDNVLQRHPLIQIHSHQNFILDYYGPEIYDTSPNISHSIAINEMHWKYQGYNITRGGMMTALQNIKHIFLRGTTWADFTQVVISNVTLDTGIYLLGSKNNLALGVEICQCPEQYNGTSCQDPANGFYRWKGPPKGPIDHEHQKLERLIGSSVPCSCNGRSEICDKETGFCHNCRDNTGGKLCDSCAEGFYGNPLINGGCKACPCPETRKNFARGCRVENDEVSCLCKPGYTGKRCEKCMTGYFGTPDREDGFCEACDCHPDGIVSDECDEETGQCNCKVGIIGRRCDRCEEPRHVIQNHKCRICDNCTLTLLDKLDDMNNLLIDGAGHVANIELVAPWSSLEAFDNETNILAYALDDFLKTKDKIETIRYTPYEKRLLRGINLFKKASVLFDKAEKRSLASENQKLEADNFLKQLVLMKDKIHDTINDLNQYGTHDHHIQLPVALKEANKLLEDIKYRIEKLPTSEFAVNCSQYNFEEFIELKELAKFQDIDLNQLKDDLSDFKMKINDMVNHQKNVEENNVDTHSLNENNEETLEMLKEKYKIIGDINEETKQYDYADKRAAFDVLSNQIMDDVENIILSDLKSLQFLNGEANKTITEAEQKYDGLKNGLLKAARKHAENLKKQSDKYRQSFQITKDGAEYALLASTAHKNISDAIEEAKKGAEQAIEAADKAQDELESDGESSVIDRGLKSAHKSDEIIDEAQNTFGNLEDLEDSLKHHRKIVDNIKNTIWKTANKNNDIISNLSNISNEPETKIVQQSIETAENISKQMRDVHTEAGNISSDIYKLKHKFNFLEPEWDTKISLAEENVTQSLSKIRSAANTLNSIETLQAANNEIFKKLNESVVAQLKELRDKIAKAKHAAEGIRVSIVSKNTIDCVRSYMPQSFGLTTSTTIKMSIALNGNSKNSNLLFIQGDGKKFIAIDMMKRKIRLIWNLGGKSAIITHPLEIEPRDPQLDDAWYQIEANRTMNFGSLTVRRMTPQSVLDNSTILTAESGIEYTRFSMSPENRIWIGGVPSDIIPKELRADVGLGIILHQLYIDDKQYGLWHFAHSEGDCGGAMLGASQTGPTNEKFFNGEGYAVVSKTRQKFRKNFFNVQMHFKTLDENALLFLAVDEKNNRSVSLTLYEGRIVFRIDYGGEIKLEINTTKKYNTGQWVNVDAAREFNKRSSENGQLKVDFEENTGSPTAPVSSDSLPDLSKALYYLGGVPPGFKSGTTKAPGADHAFLGCIKDVQINEETYDPLESSNYYGVEATCNDKISKAGFYGNGYIELPSHSLKRLANFAFVFRTLEPDCLLLLSGFPPKISDDFDSKDLRGNYSVSLVEGRVHLRMDAGHGPIELSSNVTVNDGEFHVISVTKDKRKIQLRIDDKLEKTGQLIGPSAVVNMPGEEGGLYVGGAPDLLEYDLLAPIFDFFKGSIKDMVFNNNTISFTDAIYFTNVHMGRSGPPMGSNGANNILMKSESISKSFTPAPEGCHRIGSYSYESNAFKFGDGPHSHSIVNIPTRNLWQKNFNVQFDFRTFYPNGVLFVAPGSKEKQKHFIVLQLRDGQVSLIVRGRRKEELKLAPKLNDGQWHHVSFGSHERKATLNVEIGKSGQKNSAQMKLPKKINAANMMFVGGISENSLALPMELIAKLEEFKGCIRRFTVNNSTQDLARPGRHFNVGQCFPRVEKGSYFPGDAYAIYKRTFHVGKYLELQLGFRTSELNGVLLSVSDPIGFPALSLEVHMGKIVMSCDLGDGNPFRAETNLPSKFALCDNRWHNVSAYYDSEQINLRVDNEPTISALAQHKMSGKIHTKSPLYIGGIPDTAPSGTLLSRENFKGCIRNVVIRNEIRDWTDMDGLYNVLLSECLTMK